MWRLVLGDDVLVLFVLGGDELCDARVSVGDLRRELRLSVPSVGEPANELYNTGGVAADFGCVHIDTNHWTDTSRVRSRAVVGAYDRLTDVGIEHVDVRLCGSNDQRTGGCL